MFDTLEVEEAVKEQPVPTEDTPISAFEVARAKYMKAVEDLALQIHTDPHINLDEATTTRFSTALNIRYLRDKTVCLIGVGGIGNWVVKVLISMGVTKLIIIDEDTVELHNVCPQNFGLVDLGISKAKAVSDTIMQHSGVAVRTIERKVLGYKDIIDQCGGTPDILITAVDNMEFRNTCAQELIAYTVSARASNFQSVPELFIDLRMSLGDWTAFVLPCVAMVKNMSYDTRYDLLNYQYATKACFEQSAAVQEPCTARAIGYTGANIASFVGAVLHWYTNEGRLFFNGTAAVEEFQDAKMCIRDFFGVSEYNKCQFKMHTTFSSRDWEFITPTAQARGFQNKIRQLNDDLDASMEAYEQMKAHADNMFKIIESLKSELMDKPPITIEEVESTESVLDEVLQDFADTQAPATTAATVGTMVTVDLFQLQLGTEFRLMDEPDLYKVLEINNANVSALNLRTGDTERVSMRVLTTACAHICYDPTPF